MTSRALRSRLRRLFRQPLLEPLGWRIRAWRRSRRLAEPGDKVGDRRVRVAVPPRIRAAEAELGSIAQAERIVAGPWTGSIGIELLYWIPFLRWFRGRFDVEPARVVAVSRPGAERWYAGVCGTYASSGEDGTTLSPALLEQVCAGYWQERDALVHVLDRLVFERIATESPTREGVVEWPTSADAAAITAAVDAAELLVGPWDPQLMLGPLLAVPTLALATLEAASPHLDLAYRAARALDTPLVTIDPAQVDLVTRLAAGVAR